MEGLICGIFRDSMGDCSNKGISSKVKNVTLVGDGIDKIFEATEERPAVKLVRRMIGNRPYVHAELAEPSEADKNRWCMFGGTFISTSDSRFSEAVTALGWSGPVPLHDRYESWKA